MRRYPAAMTSPAQDAGTAARLRALLADVVELVQVRLELFTVEAREELARLARMAVLGALAVVAFLSCHLFGGRGAYLQVGAMTGTIMAANVAMVIIPGQRKMVEAMQRGEAPDPRYGRWGKQRSVHNTYLTLPVIFIMISPHYPMTYQSRWNWLVLLAVGLAGALVRQYFVLRQKGANPVWLPAVATGVVALLVWTGAPRPGNLACVAMARRGSLSGPLVL